jgi:hypothetical protein
MNLFAKLPRYVYLAFASGAIVLGSFVALLTFVFHPGAAQAAAVKAPVIPIVGKFEIISTSNSLDLRDYNYGRVVELAYKGRHVTCIILDYDRGGGLVCPDALNHQ